MIVIIISNPPYIEYKKSVRMGHVIIVKNVKSKNQKQVKKIYINRSKYQKQEKNIQSARSKYWRNRGQ